MASYAPTAGKGDRARLCASFCPSFGVADPMWSSPEVAQGARPVPFNTRARRALSILSKEGGDFPGGCFRGPGVLPGYQPAIGDDMGDERQESLLVAGAPALHFGLGVVGQVFRDSRQHFFCPGEASKPLLLHQQFATGQPDVQKATIPRQTDETTPPRSRGCFCGSSKAGSSWLR